MSDCAAMSTTMSLIYNLPPPLGKHNGVAVNENSPGIAPFAFHEQHGSTTPPDGLTEETVTGFAACTTTVEVLGGGAGWRCT